MAVADSHTPEVQEILDSRLKKMISQNGNYGVAIQFSHLAGLALATDMKVVFDPLARTDKKITHQSDKNI